MKENKAVIEEFESALAKQKEISDKLDDLDQRIEHKRDMMEMEREKSQGVYEYLSKGEPIGRKLNLPQRTNVTWANRDYEATDINSCPLD